MTGTGDRPGESARDISGMARLLVGGIEVGAVYYDLKAPAPGAPKSRTGTVTGEPALLARAFREGDATLILDDGSEVPVAITDVYRAEGEAAVEIKAAVAERRRD